ncbi:MAG: hypothetical protein ABH828_00595 [archaeon]
MPRMPTYDRRRRTSDRLSRDRAKRPKTFISEESAKKYAEAHNLKNYKMVNISTINSKLKIKLVLK